MRWRSATGIVIACVVLWLLASRGNLERVAHSAAVDVGTGLVGSLEDAALLVSEWLLTNPVVVAMAGGAALLAATVGWLAGHRPVPTDPQRDFPAHLRRQAFELAGGRCEYTSILWLRCTAVAQHADHLHPWSKGGATTLANCVASCAHHNLSKGAKILSAQQVWALERRRRRYFPLGADVRAGERYQGAAWGNATRP